GRAGGEGDRAQPGLPSGTGPDRCVDPDQRERTNREAARGKFGVAARPRDPAMVQPRGTPSSRVTRQRVTEIERRGFNMMTGEERRTVYIEPIEMPTDE